MILLSPPGRQPDLMSRLTAGFAIVVVVFGGGCVGVRREAAKTSEPAPASISSTPQAPPTASATAAPTPRVVSGFVSFETPSRNIRCGLTGDSVRCDPTNHTWTTPPKPASCEFDWGGSLGVSATGAAHFDCVSDALPPGAVLPYGQSIRDGSIVCESSASGVKCTSQQSGHGFTVSRERYTLY
jgi:hypothetical protein